MDMALDPKQILQLLFCDHVTVDVVTVTKFTRGKCGHVVKKVVGLHTWSIATLSSTGNTLYNPVS